MIIAESLAKDLPSLPLHPAGLIWPTEDWPVGNMPSLKIQQLADEIFDLQGAQGVTHALLIFQAAKCCYERYDAGANPIYLQYSWSMAKSITHALVGILVRQGRLDLYAPAPVPEWQNDERVHITLDQLLRMTSGLAFEEDYVDGQASDVIPMLMGEGRHDMGAFAASKPLANKPGTVWSYSSGTTNIICRILKTVVGDGASGMLRFMNDELFEPIGITSATPKFDTSGTFIGSSFLLAIPRDFARFGLLYLRNGIWDGREILPPGWVDYARTPTYQDDEQCYGAHWWLRRQKPEWFYCGGCDGQTILCIPEKDAIIVRCGRTPEEEFPYVSERIDKIGALLPF